MNDSALRAPFRGAETELARGDGWIAQVVALSPGTALDGHVHDFPYLSLHLLGAYDEDGDVGPFSIRGPAAVFHPAGSAHQDWIGPTGLRTVIVEFDPDWLRRALGAEPPSRSCYWSGGALAARAASIARQAVVAGAPHVAAQAIDLIRRGVGAGPEPRPRWLDTAEALLEAGEVGRLEDLAARLDLSPPWLARAWRAATGEGLAQRLRRARLERAVALLEAGEMAIAEIAYGTGFADQSHLTRVCQAVIGQSPARLRAAGRRGRAETPR